MRSELTDHILFSSFICGDVAAMERDRLKIPKVVCGLASVCAMVHTKGADLRLFS